ncbi:MAG: hypothetical protein ACM3X5_05085 [Bacillota bacterium]
MKAARQIVTPEALRLVIEREFRRIAPAPCRRSSVPLPRRAIPADEVSCNWTIALPEDYPPEGQRIMAMLFLHLAARYDLAPEKEEAPSAPLVGWQA